MKFPLSDDANDYLRLVAELDALDRADKLRSEEAATLRSRIKMVWQILSPGEQKVLRLARAERPAPTKKKEKR